MEMLKFINKKNCEVNIKGKSKEEILTTLVTLASAHSDTEKINTQEIVKLLLEREKQGSTGIGEQVAIPHSGIPGLKEFIICIATSKKGVDFNAIDKKKCNLFFLILGPEGKDSEHLQILAGLSRIISHQKIRNELLKAPTQTALYEAFARNLHSENKDKKEKQKMKLLNLILFDEDLIYSILEIFIEKGIDGANILESSGMGEYISNIPLFAGFLSFMNQNTHKSKTIQALIPENQIDEVLNEIGSITGDLDSKQGAAWFVTPVENWKGSLKMM